MKNLFLTLMILSGAVIASAQSLGGGGGGDRPTTFRGVRPLTCADGVRAPFQLADSNGRWIEVWRTCENGRFFPKQEVVPLRCQDGSIQLMSWPDEFTGKHEVIPVICLNGKFKPYRRP